MSKICRETLSFYSTMSEIYFTKCYLCITHLVVWVFELHVSQFTIYFTSQLLNFKKFFYVSSKCLGFCRNLLALKLDQTWMNFFLLPNTKEDILKIVGNQIFYGSQQWKAMGSSTVQLTILKKRFLLALSCETLFFLRTWCLLAKKHKMFHLLSVVTKFLLNQMFVCI